MREAEVREAEVGEAEADVAETKVTAIATQAQAEMLMLLKVNIVFYNCFVAKLILIRSMPR